MAGVDSGGENAWLPPEVMKAMEAARAFSPLAFPTIVTPYGVAVLILLVALRPHHLLEVTAVVVFVLVLNYLAMLAADFILKSPLVATALSILGAVMGVLQIALGVQVVVSALNDMRLL